MSITPVILSGGSGTRLWPLSRASAPKQLHALFGDQTMLQATADRVRPIADSAPPLIVCGQGHVPQVVSQMREVGIVPAAVIAEPAGRNTAPAVAVAALLSPEETVMVVLPADHVIGDAGRFRDALEIAVDAARSGALVTFGIVPTRPETGYGYIRSAGEGVVRSVDAFVEKPDVATAQRFLDGGDHLWNSGMFAFTPERIIAELERHAPEVLETAGRAVEGAARTNSEIALGSAFLEAPAVSIDHAVMEHTDAAVVVPLDAGWSDVGSWAALWELEMTRDVEERTTEGRANVIVGDVWAQDVRGSYLRAQDRLVAIIGLSDVVVVETSDAVLVAARDRVQDVKGIVDRLRAEGRPEID